MGKFSDEKVTVTNAFVEETKDSLLTIGKHDWRGDKGKDAWWCYRYKDAMKQAHERFGELKNQEIENILAARDENGEPEKVPGGYNINKERIPEFNERLTEIMEIEVDLGLNKRIFDPKDAVFRTLNPDELAFMRPYCSNWNEIQAEMEKDD